MPTEVLETDVCIIGAGPSGATTSLFLSKMKIPHVIVDAAVFPRDKVCGDAIDLKVIRVLNQLDPVMVEREILNNVNFVKSKGCSIIISKDKKYDLSVRSSGNSHSDYPFFFVCKRAYFDNFLVSKIDPTYANFRQETKVKSITRDGNKWKVHAQNTTTEIEISANLVVGADGDHSAVLRSLGKRKINRQHYAGAVRQYWKGITGLHAGNYLEVYLPKSLPLAYLWIFPVGNGEANVGCGLASDLIAKKSVNLKELLQKLITEDPALAARFKNAQPLEKAIGWGLPLASGKKECAGDGWLLTGDAASLISPTTGEGIGTGMMSGYIAAHFIARAVKSKRFDKSMFVNYDREIYKRLESDIKKYNLFRSLSPMLYNWLINVFTVTGIAGYILKKYSAKWIRTAKSEPIKVNM